jgi:hypothetical protein
MQVRAVAGASPAKNGPSAGNSALRPFEGCVGSSNTAHKRAPRKNVPLPGCRFSPNYPVPCTFNTGEEPKMEYRGKRFTIVQGIGPDSWKWAVYLDEKTVKSGEAKTRSSAQIRAIWAIDKALALQKVKPAPPPRPSVRYRNEQCNFPRALALKNAGELRVAADREACLESKKGLRSPLRSCFSARPAKPTVDQRRTSFSRP